MTFRALVAVSLMLSCCHAAPVAVVDASGFQAAVDDTLQVLAEGDRRLGARLAELVEDARASATPQEATSAVQRALDEHAQLEVEINPESRVKVAPGGAVCLLDHPGWNYRLLKVMNLAGVTAPLRITSPQARSGGDASRERWLDVELYGGEAPVVPLSGARVEYRVVRLSTHAVGKRAAVIAVDVGQGTADLGFRNDVLLTFTCTKAKR